MKTGIQHLYIPGPTNVPEVVRQAMKSARSSSSLTFGLAPMIYLSFRLRISMSI